MASQTAGTNGLKIFFFKFRNYLFSTLKCFLQVFLKLLRQRLALQVVYHRASYSVMMCGPTDRSSGPSCSP